MRHTRAGEGTDLSSSADMTLPPPLCVLPRRRAPICKKVSNAAMLPQVPARAPIRNR